MQKILQWQNVVTSLQLEKFSYILKRSFTFNNNKNKKTSQPSTNI